MDSIAQDGTVVLPKHLPAQCFIQSANDYVIPQIILVALVKVETNGKSLIGKNTNGSLDLGVAQHNTKSWVPYLKTHFGIEPQSLLNDPCQSIRAAAYVLRVEMNNKACAGNDIWCAIRRYHSPNNRALGDIYARKIHNTVQTMIKQGKF